MRGREGASCYEASCAPVVLAGLLGAPGGLGRARLGARLARATRAGPRAWVCAAPGGAPRDSTPGGATALRPCAGPCRRWRAPSHGRGASYCRRRLPDEGTRIAGVRGQPLPPFKTQIKTQLTPQPLRLPAPAPSRYSRCGGLRGGACRRASVGVRGPCRPTRGPATAGVATHEGAMTCRGRGPWGADVLRHTQDPTLSTSALSMHAWGSWGPRRGAGVV